MNTLNGYSSMPINRFFEYVFNLETLVVNER